MNNQNTNDDKKERTVKKQVVAGFVVFRKTEEGNKYLLLYRRGEYWNFPKGHFEEGEKSLDTAFREVQEETGLKKTDLQVIPGFRAYEKFHFYSGNEKIYDTVILYLAETTQAQVTISPREHSGYAWFLYPDAIKILRRYTETRKVLRQAHSFIRGKNNPKTLSNSSTPHRSRPQNSSPRKSSRPGYNQRYGRTSSSSRFHSGRPQSSAGHSRRPDSQLRRGGQTRRAPQSISSGRQHSQFVRRSTPHHPLSSGDSAGRDTRGVSMG